jgi:hypothetical protein
LGSWAYWSEHFKSLVMFSRLKDFMEENGVETGEI